MLNRDPYRGIPLGVECAWPASWGYELMNQESRRDVEAFSDASISPSPTERNEP
jgi:hypothetical protein